jgi:aromatase
MSLSERREVEHRITISAPARAVYRLITEVENWPRIFPPTIYVEHLDKHEREERIHIWATANGEVKDWTSCRILDPEKLRIEFRQEISKPPVAEMGGAWMIEPLSATESQVRLLHHYRAEGLESLDWLDQAVEQNSRCELAALKANVELDQLAEEFMLSFADTLQVNGSASDVYDFINEANLWSQRLPHVSTVRLDESSAGIQTLEMETRSPDGSTHTTKSYRVTFPKRKIVYKQTTLPALMTLHTGCWTFEQRNGVTLASSQHTFVINSDNMAPILGAGATIADAKQYVCNALSANSRATLRHAKAYAENARSEHQRKES